MRNNQKRDNIKIFIGLMILLMLIIMYVGITNRLDIIIEQQSQETIEEVCTCNPIQAEVKDTISTVVTGTYYNAVEGQCDATPLITADGSKIDFSIFKFD